MAPGCCILTRDGNRLAAGRGFVGKLQIPATVTHIEEYCFTESESLSGITFSQSTSLIQIGAFAFFGATVMSIILPPSVEIVGGSSFENCRLLASFEIDPAGALSRIEKKAFRHSKLESLVLPRKLSSLNKLIWFRIGFWCQHCAASYIKIKKSSK
jgi:hypothetical protein